MAFLEHRVDPSDPESEATSPTWRPVAAELALGSRLLTLAAVAGAAALLPLDPSARAAVAAGILAGAGVASLQWLVRRRLGAVPLLPFLVASLAVWVALLAVSGGQESPLFVGLVLEIPLAGLQGSRRGTLLAAGGAAAAWLVLATLVEPPLRAPAAAVVMGAVALATWLTLGLVEALERHRRRLQEWRGALQSRARDLTSELRLLGDYLSGALVRVDGLGRVESVNPSGARLLGLDPERCAGRPWQEVLRPDARSASAVARTLDEGDGQRGVPLLLHRADDTPVSVEGELWSLPTPLGRRGFLLLDPLEARDGCEDPLRRLGVMAAAVAHQVRGSLQAMSGIALRIQSSRSGPGPPPDETQDILSALESLGSLSEDILAMAGACRPPRERVCVSQVVRSALMLARHHRARVRFEPPASEASVSVRRGQLVHALFNLVDNACKVTPAGGEIAVRIDERGGEVVVEIEDGGPGMPEEVARADGPVSSSAGSGFGLLAVRRLLEANRGRLEISRRPEGGTLCLVRLPAAGALREN